MSSIFISYRRADSAPYAGRIYDRLIGHFDEQSVFMDIDSIDPGADFVEVLTATLSQCRAMLVVIGQQWVGIADAAGRQRLAKENDFVRLEVKMALESDMLVIPLLVGGARMPAEGELPASLAALSRRQSISIRDDGFHKDLDEVIESLQNIVAADGSGNVSGRWLATAASASGQSYKIRFDLQALDDTLMGSVHFPTGSAGILAGKIDGGKISFRSEHIPQFDTEKAVFYFRGTLTENRIHFYMQSDQGLSEFYAVKKT